MQTSNLRVLIGLLIAFESAVAAQPSEAASKQTVALSAETSPRITELKKQIVGGDTSALSRFWAALEKEHTPLLEPVPDQAGKSLVTFIWRGELGTTGVSVVGRPLSRLLDTDLWFVTDMMDSGTPMFYAFFPSVAGVAKGRFADPLNPRRFAVPDDVLAALPADLKGDNSQWLKTSILLFRESPSDRWTEPRAGTPNGKIEMFKVEDKQRPDGRRVWVYTPPNYESAAKQPCRLLICFNGPSYAMEIPVPTILDNLLAADQIWPTVAVMVDNGDLKSAAEDLDNHAVFADYIADQLLPWIRKSWNVSTDPGQTLLCGYSRGGSGAAYVAWKHPELFGNVLAQSGAFWRGNEGSSEGPEWLTQQIRNTPKAALRFFIDVGAQETRPTPGGPIFIDANRHLNEALTSKGYPVRYVEVAGGRHDPVHWRAQFPDGILFLAGKNGRSK